MIQAPKKMIVCCLLLLGAIFSFDSAWAQNDPAITSLLQGNAIKEDTAFSVQDTVFFNPLLKPTILRTHAVHNIISLRINEYSNAALPDSFEIKIEARLYYTDENNLSDSSTKIFTIHYNKLKKYKSRDVHFEKNGYRMTVKILKITPVYAPVEQILPALEFENKLQIVRDYVMNPVAGDQMNCSANAIVQINKDVSSIQELGELKIFWVPNPVIEKYDVEWAWLNKSALDNGNYHDASGQLNPALIFKNNATRITTTANTCMIPLLYDGEGSLFYRVRGVQEDPAGELITTSWSSQFEAGLGRHDLTGHERKLNWQATNSFAEDAKRKTVVQYFDGSLRNRQTVTRDNTTQTIVVAETFYDHQGRPVIQVLPSPTLSKLIGYTPDFNVANMNGAEYDKGIYDPLMSAADYCDTGADSMSVSSGAAQYYSPGNLLKDDGYHQFIPNAFGFAFTETRYSQDNTGRITRQSGVGEKFRIGSGHETKYFYGTPEQTDLDALFGTEAGEASHYQKNMVRDANGQYSVSYVDMHGRTVATALSGDSTLGLQRLKSYRDSIQTEQLLNLSNNVINGNKIQSSKSILVSKAGEHTFSYGLATESLTIEDCRRQNICYDCLYDLTITITDDCNNEKTGGSPIIISKSNFKLFEIDTTCNLINPIDTTFTRWLEPGSYYITKELSISEEGMQYYRDSLFLKHNTCLSYDSIFSEQKAIVRNDINCDNTPEPQYEYQSYRRDMVMDLFPLIGQFADTVQNRDCSFSVLNNGIANTYRDSRINYVNDDGNPAYIYRENGDSILPQNATLDEFMQNFQRSWADSMIVVHPEYNLLIKYESYAASHQWEEGFLKTETYAEAKIKGYLNPANSTQPPASQFPVNNPDPLFSLYSESAIARQSVEDSLFNFQNFNGVPVSLWGFATAIAKCPNADPMDLDCVLQWDGNPFNESTLCEGELDMAWKFFRNQYVNEKHDWMLGYIKSTAGFPIINTPCLRNFTDANSLLQMEGFNLTEQDTSVLHEQANQFYADNCKAYATRWWQQLQNSCNYYNTGDSTVLINYLVEVCQQGSDIDHPYGSGSVKPGSTYRFKNFEEVIQFYNDSTGRVTDINCNSYLLDKPLPYEHSVLLVNKPLYTKPDSCECEKINEFHDEFQRKAAAYGNFSNFMLLQYQTKISQNALDSLMNLCNGIISCKYISNIVYLPPALQCLVSVPCIPCGTATQLYDSFLVKFPGKIPLREEADTVQQHINQVFTGYMNHHTGFSKSNLDYLDFMDSCRNYVSEDCDTLQSIIKNYVQNIKPGRVTHNLLTQEGQSFTKFSQIVDTGTIHFPDSIRQRPGTWYNNYGINTNRLCTNNGYTAEIRFKFLENNLRGHVFYSNWGIGYTVSREFSGARKGLSMEIADTVLIFDNDPYALLNWMSFKAKVLPSIYYLYYNDRLILTRNTNPATPIGDRTGFGMGLRGRHAAIDYVKIGDANENVLYFEDFNSIDYPATVDPSFICPPPPPCQTTFSNYYNQIKGTHYSFSQIDSLYLSNCGKPLDVCSINPQPDTSISLSLSNGPMLCGKAPAFDEPFVFVQDDPCADSTAFAIITATERYRIYKDSLAGAFEEAYRQKCLNAINLESFTVTHPVSEYHYTLYYYGLAGNLIKTIPPEGVHPNRNPQWLQDVKQKRKLGERLTPAHTLPTGYRYNSLNQVISQQSPDGGVSEFWYDRLGRLAISRNAKQKQEGKYSYTLYDALGRITEVGQKQQTVAMDNMIARNPTELDSWLKTVYLNENGSRCIAEQVTATIYDLPDVTAGLSTLIPLTQQAYTLRNRVSYTRTYDYLFANSGNNAVYGNYDFSTSYCYDIHGNVDTLFQQYRKGVMAAHGDNRFKIIAYQYDLISGKVNQVHYQPGLRDQLFHRYEYDAENRVTGVYITDNKLLIGDVNLEEHDAYYDYYKHGPLARTVLGQQQVQGLDYAYTLQGWLKAVNADSTLDNRNVARDAYNYSLHYFNGDYHPIGSNTIPIVNASANAAFSNLYNGNIGAMAVNIKKLNQPLVYNYGYDQLNRLVSMDAYKGWNGKGIFAPDKIDDYHEKISYDGNGNILSYFRNGSSADGKPIAMDHLQYAYNKDAHGNISNNRLRHVKDAVGNANYSEDIDNQSDDNYVYDVTGNLIKDNAEKIENIEWNVYGKIQSITKTATTKGDVQNIHYEYDASGNRISKIVKKKGIGASDYTWYTRDASGNVMAVYTYSGTNLSNGKLQLSEQHLYGSSRLGIWNRNINVNTLIFDGKGISFERGNKFFELPNQLGNVLVTVSDKKIGHSTDGTTIDFYNADVVAAQDYYPGMLMAGRKYSVANTGYRYGFNGKEKDKETTSTTTYDYGFRIYSPALGRFLSVDPLTKGYPALTPYQYASNNPIEGIDLDGLEYVSSKQVRIEVIRGIVKLKVENMTTVVKNMLNNLNADTKNWGDTKENIGIDLNIGHINLAQMAPQAPNSDPDPSDANPNYRADQTEIGKPTAARTGLPDRRYSDKTVTTASPAGAKGLAVLQIAMEVFVTGANWYRNSMIKEDESMINKHIGFFKAAAADVNYAMSKGMIPKEFQTQEYLSDIINVVLSGNSYINSTDQKAGTKILEIGQNIYNTLSVKRNEYTGKTIETGGGLDGIPTIKVPERNVNYDAQYVKENPPL